MNPLAQLIAYRQKPQEFERMENVFHKRHKEQHKRKIQSETLDRHDSSAADSRCIAGRMRHTGKRSGNGTDCITVRCNCGLCNRSEKWIRCRKLSGRENCCDRKYKKR